MKASEILRKLADMIDGHSDGQESVEAVPAVELAPVEVDNTDNTETSTMIPPLQQKLELLKKATGVDNQFDSQSDCGCEGPCDCASQTDSELALIKQRAGVISPAVVVASEDNDVVG